MESETVGRAVLGWAIFPSRRDRNQEVAIVGMPEECWGEAPHAFVVLKAAATATETELRNYARDHLAHFKANSDLRLQTSDSEEEQERCIRPSSFLRHSSFACQAVALAKAGASSFVCPLLLCPSYRKQPPARSRNMSFAASPRFRSSDRPNVKLS